MVLLSTYIKLCVNNSSLHFSPLSSPILFCVELFNVFTSPPTVSPSSVLLYIFYNNIVKIVQNSTHNHHPFSSMWKKICVIFCREQWIIQVLCLVQRPNACFIDPRMKQQEKKPRHSPTILLCSKLSSVKKIVNYSLLSSLPPPLLSCYFQDHEIWFCNRKASERERERKEVKTFCKMHKKYFISFFAHFELGDFSSHPFMPPFCVVRR